MLISFTQQQYSTGCLAQDGSRLGRQGPDSLQVRFPGSRKAGLLVLVHAGKAESCLYSPQVGLHAAFQSGPLGRRTAWQSKWVSCSPQAKGCRLAFGWAP